MDSENYRYHFIAGNLALDFVNTVAFRADPGKTKDHLQRAEDVRRWASQAQLPDRAEINSGPLVGSVALRRIRAVREQLFAIFQAIANDDPIPADTLALVGDELNHCRAKRCLSLEGTEVRWTWRPGARCTDYLLYPVLTSAADVLTVVSRGLIRQCADAGCGWLFLDRSNAGKRRWCRMSDCGNRDKARKYYRREAGLI
jgi:predicted RNA-binding Zn ribbon-like protein